MKQIVLPSSNRLIVIDPAAHSLTPVSSSFSKVSRNLYANDSACSCIPHDISTENLNFHNALRFRSVFRSTLLVLANQIFLIGWSSPRFVKRGVWWFAEWSRVVWTHHPPEAVVLNVTRVTSVRPIAQSDGRLVRVRRVIYVVDKSWLMILNQKNQGWAKLTTFKNIWILFAPAWRAFYSRKSASSLREKLRSAR